MAPNPGTTGEHTKFAAVPVKKRENVSFSETEKRSTLFFSAQNQTAQIPGP